MSKIIRDLSKPRTVQGVKDLMQADRDMFAEYDAGVAARAAEAEQGRRQRFNSQVAADEAEIADTRSQVDAIKAPPAQGPRAEDAANERAQRKAWTTFVSGSAARQDRYDPGASQANWDARVQGHKEHRDAVVAKHGMRPEELQRQGIPEHLKKKQYLDQMAVRYRHLIAKDPSIMDQIIEAYESSASGGHVAGVDTARGVIDGLSRHKNAQIALNVDNAARQTNVARQFGTSRGHIMAMEDINASMAAGDRPSAYAKMAMYGMDPKALHDGHAVLAAEAKAEGEARAAEAGRKDTPTAPESFDAAMDSAHGEEPGPTRVAKIRQAHSLALGANADPKAVEASVRSSMQPYVQDYLKRGVHTLTPRERIELQQTIGSMSYGEFVKYAGVADTPDLEQTYQQLTGRNASYRQWAEQSPLIPDFLFPRW